MPGSVGGLWKLEKRIESGLQTCYCQPLLTWTAHGRKIMGCVRLVSTERRVTNLERPDLC